MEHKRWFFWVLGIVLCGAVVSGSAVSSLGDDGFYVIPVTNPNIKIADENTAIGMGALQSNTTGGRNTATGYRALFSNVSGSNNVAIGIDALYSNDSGYANVGVGPGALRNNTSGHSNTALGYGAGFNMFLPSSFTGHGNIYIGQWVVPSTSDESDTIRIGNIQTRTFIRGIYGASVTEALPVYVKYDGQLGIVSSSRRFKEHVQDMNDASSGLMSLRPVTFYYKPEYADGPRTLQYGLIAEEVAEVYPGLVLYDPESGEPETVSYHLINAMLLNEVQKQQRQVFSHKMEISGLNLDVSDLNQQLSGLRDRLSKLEALLSMEISERERRIAK